jgi:hypothetical protein
MRAPRLARKENQEDMGKSAGSVVCRFQYSGRAIALVAALALATLALLALVPAAPLARTLAGAWVVCLALAAARRLPHGPIGRGPRAIALRASGEVAVRSAAGEWRLGELRAGCFVAPWLIIVRWRPQGERHDRTLLILPGMAQAEALRKIRVILRWR